MDKPWDNSNKSSRLGNSSQHTTGWGSTFYTPCLTIAASGWSTNDRSSSLVTNEDVSAAISVRSSNGYPIKEYNW